MSNVEQEISKMHKEIEEIKEALDMIAESYIESLHQVLEKDKADFISLEEYGKRHGLRS